jgi:GTP-binding protein
VSFVRNGFKFLEMMLFKYNVTFIFAIFTCSGKGGKDSLDGAMIRQTMEAARRSDLVLLLFDARVGVTSDLSETIRWLRKISHSPKDSADGENQHRDIVILANKLEGDRWASMDNSVVLDNLAEISRCGFGEAIPISAEHGEGMAEVASAIHRLTQESRKRLGLPLDTTNEDDLMKDDNAEKALQLAILGQINVGK